MAQHQRGRSPVAQRGDEVEATVDTVVHDVSAVQAALVVEVALKLVVDVGDDGAEAVRRGRGVRYSPGRGKVTLQRPCRTNNPLNQCQMEVLFHIMEEKEEEGG